jgi:hypothetical protein
MPGFTHLQTAQPVTFGHHCMAYVEMFGRDRQRVRDASKRLDECPLGAAALAGTGFPIDRDMTAKALGFREPTRNSIDTVSDRDFALEFLSLASSAPPTCRGWPRRSSSGRRRNSASSACPTPFRPARRSCRRRKTRMRPNWCAPRPAASTGR